MRDEAKLERTVAFRRRLLLLGWLTAVVVVVGRSAELQLLEGATWNAEAERQHRRSSAVPAPRGTIFDRDGVPLATSHETFRVSVAPHELKDRVEVATILAGALELSVQEARRVTQSNGRWVALPGRYGAAAREALNGVQGVYVEREIRRFYPHEDLARGILGGVVDDEGRGGIEQELDAVLRGHAGEEMSARDSRGRTIPGESWQVRSPRSGDEVVLTLDLDLQEIAHEALSEAVESTGARGGDILVTDPSTGEILAMVSIRDGRLQGLSTINAPYEPGSTLKPFTVAALLSNRMAALADSVDTENGRWRVAGRVLSDVHAEGRITLADALRLSSNVGIAKIAQQLTPAQQYEALRDFGFGTATGISIPGENAGLLRRPHQWSRQSPASLAIGYEIAVTPIQMAMAYGALANGGVLMEPRLVREVRDPAGRVTRTFPPRVVRRVASAAVTRELGQVLVDAVEDGTGRAARLATFTVAGKSGTSRAYDPRGGYALGKYYSSFAGFFPAEDPQLVVFVKLEDPKGEYYGGATAAPVTRATMEAVLAARRPPLDRRALISVASRQRVPPVVQHPAESGESHVRFASHPPPTPERPRVSTPGRDSNGAVEVPDVRGMPTRMAARRLHAFGFRVIWEESGPIVGTRPAAGERSMPGDTIRLLARGGGDE
ncbi:MAG: penicillin-binding transpeptidase domain-containing protein [Gemmatimonadota bacterium]